MRYLSSLFLLLILLTGCDSAIQPPAPVATFNLSPSPVHSVQVVVDQVILKEGVDYSLNRHSGTVSILNEAWLQPEAMIEITYDPNWIISD